MADYAFISMLEERLEGEFAFHALHLVEGKAADYADYRHRVGILLGIRKAQDVITQATKDKNEEDFKR